MDEQTEVIQRHNRAARKVIRLLRRQVSRLIDETDTKMALLWDASSRAEDSLEKIRALGGIDCDSGDYDTVVDVCLAALGKTKPIDQ